ncbi:hypothetical protein PSECIP111854_00189 [Pseudoalteromonas sp. CIP111854]|uniref:Uncharacterized protein n=1 Tax=Pseudoalteromonas holothuriae TaxID=2963714 RepID=A0A9W4QR21_9GAMM|nr:hypothetical protein [Pseudoalteromonas sp. CIP111854]CAH9049547.1 hypothetical protein PSECIP111854_00189 [Pseudoalteromonas sp. CIP111854]
MSKLIFGLLTPDGEQLDEFQTKLREFTIAFSRYGYREEIVEASDIEQLLIMAIAKNAQYCLIQSVGHVIDEQWYLPHWHRQGFHQSIQKLCDYNDFLIAGQLYCSENNTLGIETSCILINLSQYKKLGQPSFGEIDWQPREVLCASPAQSMSVQTLWQKKTKPCDIRGWQFLLSSYQHQLVVRAFSEDINYNRFDLNVSQSNQAFAARLRNINTAFTGEPNLAATQQTFLNRAQKQIQSAKKGVFLLNIESYDDVDNEVKGQPLDTVFSVAAGFKAYRILAAHGFHASSKVVLFDYSKQALAVRQYIVEHWNGEDFTTFVKQVFQQFPEPHTFYQLWHNTNTTNIDWQDLERLWQAELTRWGGADNFKKMWQKFSALEHRFIHVDLLQNKQALFDEIKISGNSYIWWSNAFFTIYSHWHFSAEQRHCIYGDWVNALATAAGECRVNGADHHNCAVNGLTALAYSRLFQKQTGGELNPQQLSCLDIQF